MLNKKSTYIHNNFTTISKNFDTKTGIITNIHEGFTVIGKVENSAPFYSIIFEIPGFDFTEMVSEADYKRYVNKVFDLFEHLVLDWNIIGVNKTIDFTKQINYWTKKLNQCKDNEIQKALTCQRNREYFLSFSKSYQEAFYFVEIFCSNSDTLIQLPKFLPSSNEVKIRQITNIDEVIKVKRAVLNPLGSTERTSYERKN